MAAELSVVAVLEGHVGCVWNVAWHPFMNMLASCGADKSIRIWVKAGDTYECRSVLGDAHSRSLRSVAFSPCGRYLASASFDSTTVLWEKSGDEYEIKTTLEGPETEVKCVAWSPSGQYLAVCGRDKSVWIWEVDEDEDVQCAAVLIEHSQDVKSVVWQPLDDVLASASYDKTINFYKFDGEDWLLDEKIAAHDSTVWTVSFNKSGRRFASCSSDKTVKVWKYVPSGGGPHWRCDSTLRNHHSRPIYSLSWSPTSDVIATACGDNGIRVFQENRKPAKPDEMFHALVVERNAHSQDVNCVSWSRANDLLASCGDDSLVKVWKFNPDLRLADIGNESEEID